MAQAARRTEVRSFGDADDSTMDGTTSIVLAGEAPDQIIAMVDWLDNGFSIDISGLTINGISVPLELFSEETVAAWAEEIADGIRQEADALGIVL